MTDLSLTLKNKQLYDQHHNLRIMATPDALMWTVTDTLSRTVKWSKLVIVNNVGYLTQGVISTDNRGVLYVAPVEVINLGCKIDKLRVST